MISAGEGHQPPLVASDEEAPNPVAAIEALLFASSEGETISRLATALQWTAAAVRQAVEEFQLELASSRRGLVLQRNGDHLQLVTAPEFGPTIQRLLGLERMSRLSGAALETLALVAYRQPITRSEVEGVRGVDSASVIATLLARELIEARGRRASPGAPMEYGTSSAFLQAFGLASLADLPPLPAESAQVNGHDAPREAEPEIIQRTRQDP